MTLQQDVFEAKNLTGLWSYWSIVPLVLKPDALEGEYVTAAGAAASDFAAYLAAALQELSFPNEYVPLVATSSTGARRAREHALAEMRVVSWYRVPPINVSQCQERLEALRLQWAQVPSLHVSAVVQMACGALDFQIISSIDRVLTDDDYTLLYADPAHPDVDHKRRLYMVGRTVCFLLACGQQQNTALHIMKTYLRYVMRHPVEKRTVENWIHVTNPDDPNYPRLVAMCGGASL